MPETSVDRDIIFTRKVNGLPSAGTVKSLDYAGLEVAIVIRHEAFTERAQKTLDQRGL